MIPAEIICSCAHEKHAGASCWLQIPWHKGTGAPAAGIHQGKLEFVPAVGSVKRRAAGVGAEEPAPRLLLDPGTVPKTWEIE